MNKQPVKPNQNLPAVNLPDVTLLYHPKKSRQNALASSLQPKNFGNAG